MKDSYKKVYLMNEEFVDTISQDELRYLLRREQIQSEINANKVDIDRECFKHMFIEKKKLKEEKKSYNKLKDTPKLKEEQDKLLIQIVTSKYPIRCGSLIIGRLS